jgi:hypothetical protein
MAGGRAATAMMAILLTGTVSGCDRFGGAEARLDKMEAQQKTCEEAAAGDPTQLMACHHATIAAAGKLAGRGGEAAYETLLGDLFEPLLLARTGGEDALAERVTVSAAFAELSVRRAAILTGAAQAKGPQGTVRVFAGWPDAAAGKAFAARWTAIRSRDCDAYPVKNCARRMDANLKRTLRDLRPAARRGSTTSE